MKAQLLDQVGTVELGSCPLRFTDVADPEPTADEVLLRVRACGVCHTELDEIEGRVPPAFLPMVLGHQVVGHVVARGAQVSQWKIGQRVGVAWIFSACGHCEYCGSQRENLCSEFQATGRDRFGGYAEMMTAPAAFIHAIPDALSDFEAAPMLCAGAIGYRSLRLTQLDNGQSLGLMGFGASAHLVLKMVLQRMPHTRIYVFARSERERAFALELGAAWAGTIQDRAPRELDAIIDTTPAWLPMVKSLENLVPGGRLVVNAIRKEAIDQSELLRLNYPQHLWLEKEIKSVANVTRQDVREFLELAVIAELRPKVQVFSLADANKALVELKTQSALGAKVLGVG